MMNIKRYMDGSVFLFIAALLIVGWTYMEYEQSGTYHPKEERVVTEGETLWSIAKHVSEDLDLQLEETIYWMKEENELQGATIHPGQRIDVPAEWNGVASD
jgi:hypothetical protein